MKKVAIMQPYLFPYIGYFQLINAVDEFIIYDDVQHIVRGWINRNNYLINNQKKLLSLSVAGASSNKKINELEFIGDFDGYLRTIEQAYSKAPYAKPVLEIIDRILAYPDKSIAHFVENSLLEVMHYIGKNPKFLHSSQISKNRNLKGQEKILAICRELDAGMYINPTGGKDLYDKAIFRENNIDLRFIESHIMEYRQWDNNFIPGLSIIDVLMFNSPEKIREMLKEYELV